MKVHTYGPCNPNRRNPSFFLILPLISRFMALSNFTKTSIFEWGAFLKSPLHKIYKSQHYLTHVFWKEIVQRFQMCHQIWDWSIIYRVDLLTFTLTLNFVRSVYFDFFLNFVKERSKGLLKHIKKLDECYFLFFSQIGLKKNSWRCSEHFHTYSSNKHTCNI